MLLLLFISAVNLQDFLIWLILAIKYFNRELIFKLILDFLFKCSQYVQEQLKIDYCEVYRNSFFQILQLWSPYQLIACFSEVAKNSLLSLYIAIKVWFINKPTIVMDYPHHSSWQQTIWEGNCFILASNWARDAHFFKRKSKINPSWN